MMKDALLTEPLDHGYLRCHVCQRRCTIAPGHRGACRTRENVDGRLSSLIADRVSSACLDPIEKKPLYHFLPGTLVYSLGALGCSFTCPGCQNWQLSQRAPLAEDPALTSLPPAAAVATAVRLGAAGMCWTYNEPAIWLEYTLECARLAKHSGLYTAYVTNGTATREHLDLIGPYLDAYRVDIKGSSPASYRAVSGWGGYEGILDSTQYARTRWQMHVECVTNVTPTVNDSDEELRGIARWIATALGPETPWHVTRFHPYEGFAHLPVTPLKRLDRAYALGQEAGLRHIYVGNVPGDPRQDTRCPGCGDTVIQRHGYTVVQEALRPGTCPRCGMEIAGRWSS